MIKQLRDLTIGDFVCTSSGYHGYEKGIIKRITKTQLIVSFTGSETKHNRISGYLVGGSGYHDKIEPCTPEILIKIRRHSLKSSIEYMLVGHNFRETKVTDENECHFRMMKTALTHILKVEG